MAPHLFPTHIGQSASFTAFERPDSFNQCLVSRGLKIAFLEIAAPIPPSTPANAMVIENLKKKKKIHLLFPACLPFPLPY